MSLIVLIWGLQSKSELVEGLNCSMFFEKKSDFIDVHISDNKANNITVSVLFLESYSLHAEIYLPICELGWSYRFSNKSSFLKVIVLSLILK